MLVLECPRVCSVGAAAATCAWFVVLYSDLGLGWGLLAAVPDDALYRAEERVRAGMGVQLAFNRMCVNAAVFIIDFAITRSFAAGLRLHADTIERSARTDMKSNRCRNSCWQGRIPVVLKRARWSSRPFSKGPFLYDTDEAAVLLGCPAAAEVPSRLSDALRTIVGNLIEYSAGIRYELVPPPAVGASRRQRRVAIRHLSTKVQP
eukprot:gene4785-biopygen11331